MARPTDDKGNSLPRTHVEASGQNSRFLSLELLILYYRYDTKKRKHRSRFDWTSRYLVIYNEKGAAVAQLKTCTLKKHGT